MYQFLLLTKKLSQNSDFKQQFISPDSVGWLGGSSLSYLGALLYLHSAGKMAGCWDGGASLSSGLPSLFSVPGSFRAIFQEGHCRSHKALKI